MMVRILAALMAVAMVGGCGAMTKRAPKELRALGPLIKDPAWIKGNCQNELRRKGVMGLCSVVTLARGRFPSNPLEVGKAALRQGKPQLADAVRGMLMNLVNACQSQCGRLPDGGPRVQLVGRLTEGVLESARVADTWLAQDDNLYALLAIDLDAITSVIHREPNLDAEARQALANRAREHLRRQ